MKPKKILAGLSAVMLTAVVITTFILEIPVRAGGPTIELSKDRGAAGTTVTIRGYDFSEGYYYYVFFDESYQSRATVNSRGKFIETLTIPFSAEDGLHEITVSASASNDSVPDIHDNYGESADAELQVVSGKIKLEPDTGKPGTSVTINGSDFTGKYYYVFFDRNYKCEGTLSDEGSFTGTLNIPFLTDNRTYSVVVAVSKFPRYDPDITDNFDEEAVAVFKVDAAEADVEIDRNISQVGDIFMLSGSGFSTGKIITVFWDSGTPIGQTLTSDASGNFTGAEYIVPETTFGSHTIKIADAVGKYDNISYTVTPEIKLSMTTIPGGDSVMVSGTGFAASSLISFYVDSTLLDTGALTSSRGTLSSTRVILPGLSADKYVFKVKDNSDHSAWVNINITYPTPERTAMSPIQVYNQTQVSTGRNQPVLTAAPATQQPVKASSSTSHKWVPILVITAVIIIGIVSGLLIRLKHRTHNGEK